MNEIAYYTSKLSSFSIVIPVLFLLFILKRSYPLNEKIVAFYVLGLFVFQIIMTSLSFYAINNLMVLRIELVYELICIIGIYLFWEVHSKIELLRKQIFIVVIVVFGSAPFIFVDSDYPKIMQILIDGLISILAIRLMYVIVKLNIIDFWKDHRFYFIFGTLVYSCNNVIIVGLMDRTLLLALVLQFILNTMVNLLYAWGFRCQLKYSRSYLLY